MTYNEFHLCQSDIFQSSCTDNGESFKSIKVEVDLGSKQAFRPLCDPLLVYIQSHLYTCTWYMHAKHILRFYLAVIYLVDFLVIPGAGIRRNNIRNPAKRGIKELGIIALLDISSNSSGKLKFCKISFIHNIHISYKVVLKFCTEHGNITAVLCKIWKRLVIQQVLDKRFSCESM